MTPPPMETSVSGFWGVMMTVMLVEVMFGETD